MCFYDVGLWNSSQIQVVLLQVYQGLFGYKRFDSVTYMLCDLSLHIFDTVILNSKCCLIKMQCRMTNNVLVSRFLLLYLY